MNKESLNKSERIINKYFDKIERKLERMLEKTDSLEAKEKIKERAEMFTEKIKSEDLGSDYKKVIETLYDDCLDDLDDIIYDYDLKEKMSVTIDKYSQKISQKLNNFLSKVDKSKVITINNMKDAVERFKEEIKTNIFNDEDDIYDLYEDCLDELDDIYEASEEDDYSEEIILEIKKYLNKIEEKKNKYTLKLQDNSEAIEKINSVFTKYENKLKAENFDEDYEEDIADLYDDYLDELDEIYYQYKENRKEKDDTQKAKTVISLNIGDLKKGKNKKIFAMLPFMSESDIDDCIDKILADDKEMKGVNICVFLPFASQKKVNKIFDEGAKGNERVNINAVIPFVCQEKLSEFVNEYVEGKYQNININSLYPFLKSEDVKKIFEYVMKKENNK